MKRPALVIFRKEWKEILRDRRAIFTSILLPVAIYPLLLFLLGSMTERQVESFERRRLRIGVEDPAELVRPRLLADSTLELAAPPVDSLDVVHGRVEALLVLPERLEPAADPVARLIYHGARETSDEARDRLIRHLRAFADEERQRRFENAGGRADLDSLVVSRSIDVASREEASGARLAEFLPFILVVILLTGSSFVALDILPGEKERGTLETLFVHPVPASSVAWGKILVVVSVGILAGTLNLASMVGSAELGLAEAFGQEIDFSLSPRSILAILILLLPLAVFLGGILMIVAAYARSYREASNYITPVMLLTFLPLMLAAGPGMELDPLLALVPVANVALAFREALVARFQTPYLIMAFLSTAFYAAISVRLVARLLQKEEIVLAHESRPLLAAVGKGRERLVPARTTMVFAALMILLVYYVGQTLQSRDPYLGLVLTLWGLVAVPALLYARWASGSWREGLALRGAPGRFLFAALLAALPLTLLVQAYVELQNLFLPVPQSLIEQFEELFAARELVLWQTFLLFSISPGICEELLFRGSIQQALTRVLSPGRVILFTAITFGIIHLSVYRFVPTALIGLVLAYLVYRSGSIFPAMILHAAYNALAIFGEDLFGEGALGDGLAGWWIWLLGTVFAGAAFALLGRPRGREPRVP